jgi:hypothetical protein
MVAVHVMLKSMSTPLDGSGTTLTGVTVVGISPLALETLSNLTETQSHIASD